MVGWTIFRASSMAQLGGLLDAMIHPGRWGGVIAWHNDTRLALAASVVIALAPRLAPLDGVLRWLLAAPTRRSAVEAAALLLFVVALSKAVADPFRPFLYFRF